jgi:hypothetical protein
MLLNKNDPFAAENRRLSILILKEKKKKAPAANSGDATGADTPAQADH